MKKTHTKDILKFYFRRNKETYLNQKSHPQSGKLFIGLTTKPLFAKANQTTQLRLS